MVIACVHKKDGRSAAKVEVSNIGANAPLNVDQKITERAANMEFPVEEPQAADKNINAGRDARVVRVIEEPAASSDDARGNVSVKPALNQFEHASERHGIGDAVFAPAAFSTFAASFTHVRVPHGRLAACAHGAEPRQRHIDQGGNVTQLKASIIDHGASPNYFNLN
jgi:hypothetical protein